MTPEAPGGRPGNSLVWSRCWDRSPFRRGPTALALGPADGQTPVRTSPAQPGPDDQPRPRLRSALPAPWRDGARALSKALSMARAALSNLGEPGAASLAGRLSQHLGHAGFTVSIDAERQEPPSRPPSTLALASSVTTASSSPCLKLGSCFPTSRTPIGRFAARDGLRPCANRPAWPWPGTGAVASGAQTTSASFRPGKHASQRTHLRGGRDCPRVGILQARASRHGGGDI